MTTINIKKCHKCKNFLGSGLIEPTTISVPNPATLFCKAFSKNIPFEILSWDNPHTSVRDDQIGDFIFGLSDKYKKPKK